MVKANIGQLERELSQRIIKFYNDRIGKPPSQIICHFFDTEVVISLENSVSQAEQTLLRGGYDNLAEQVRLYLEKIIKPELKSLIEEIIDKPVIDLTINTNLATDRTGIIVVFNQLSEAHNPESISQSKCQECG
ncbi:MAG: DUF2294 domain-containing protein [Nostoc sp.]|uniref:DUF2294 domain-containing protein n=1 Tax=Nostoc sp. TaxID=1180 RepID=UPI002FEF2E75